jgi:transcriptional regulator with XRE-family HTH domain
MSPKKLAVVITRLRGDMTQEELARRAKVSRGYLAAIEAGHKKNPSLGVLQRLAKALGVPVTELLG